MRTSNQCNAEHTHDARAQRQRAKRRPRQQRRRRVAAGRPSNHHTRNGRAPIPSEQRPPPATLPGPACQQSFSSQHIFFFFLFFFFFHFLTWSMPRLGSAVMTVRAEKSTRFPMRFPRMRPSLPLSLARRVLSGFPDLCVSCGCPARSLSNRAAT